MPFILRFAVASSHVVGSIAAFVLASASVLSAAEKPDASRMKTHPISVAARPFRTFAKSGAGAQTFGKLRFLGGLVLTSPDPAFGGFSGIEISGMGRQLLAVSDAGVWLSGEIRYSGRQPTAISGALLGPILALRGRRLQRGWDRDAEAVRLLSGDIENGVVLVGFELNSRIGLFDVRGGRIASPTHYLRPPLRLARNKGIEAVGLIKAGRHRGAVVAFAERTLDGNGHHRGWLWPAMPVRKDGRYASKAVKSAAFAAPLNAQPLALAVRDVGGFDLTDVAGALDGGLYLLERRFRWSEGVRMRIRQIAGRDVKAGAVLDGSVLIEADFDYEVDNMEGLAMHRDGEGRTILTLISDDNFNGFLQRTLLLQFELP